MRVFTVVFTLLRWHNGLVPSYLAQSEGNKNLFYSILGVYILKEIAFIMLVSVEPSGLCTFFILKVLLRKYGFIQFNNNSQ
jgi:hypothetical protein